MPALVAISYQKRQNQTDKKPHCVELSYAHLLADLLNIALEDTHRSRAARSWRVSGTYCSRVLLNCSAQWPCQYSPLAEVHEYSYGLISLPPPGITHCPHLCQSNRRDMILHHFSFILKITLNIRKVKKHEQERWWYKNRKRNPE